MLNKLLSGRWLLTVICGLVFGWASISGQFDAAAIGVIVTMVFKDYFGRDDRQPKEIK